MCMSDIASGERPANSDGFGPSRNLRIALAIAGSVLSGYRAMLSAFGEAKPRDFDQVWFAANALFAGRNPYLEIGPGLPFDWPAPLYYPLTSAVVIAPLAALARPVA